MEMMEETGRQLVVLDLSVLQGLSRGWSLRENIDIVLSKVLLAETVRRVRSKSRKAKDPRVERVWQKIRRLLTDPDLEGRVHIAMHSWDITERESGPLLVDPGHRGLVEDSAAIIDTYRGYPENLPALSKGDIAAQREFDALEIRWVEWVKDMARTMVEEDASCSDEEENEEDDDLHEQLESHEKRVAFVGAMRGLFGRGRGAHLLEPAWDEYLLESSASCMRPAFSRMLALTAAYAMQAMANLESKMDGDFHDQEYIFAASYAGALCTEDGGAKGDKGMKLACKSAFGSRVQLLGKHDVFVWDKGTRLEDAPVAQ